MRIVFRPNLLQILTRKPSLRSAAKIFGLALALNLSLENLSAAEIILVPEGNRNVEQPAVPGASQRRTRSTKTTFDKKYQKVVDLLKSDAKLRKQIKKSAEAYGIDPIHIVGALIGEHTYNVDVVDRLQLYYVKARAYAEEDFAFKHERQSISAFLKNNAFEKCASESGSHALWSCREQVFNSAFRGKTVDGISYPDDRFSKVFFQPFLAGQTFGLGQVNPLTALKVSDLVKKVSGGPRLSENKAGPLYREIMRPDSALNYVAAIIRLAIEDYKKIAKVDISGNPGLTATLYNLGDSRTRAQKLATTNKARAAKGQKLTLPQENYYGWLVNDKLDELRAIF